MLIIHLPFVAASWILTFFFIPETQFRRSSANLARIQVPEHRTDSKEKIEEGSEVFEEENVGEQRTVYPSTNVSKKTYLQNLAIFSGTYTDISLPKLIVAPFVVLHNPGVIWVSLNPLVKFALLTSLPVIGYVWCRRGKSHTFLGIGGVFSNCCRAFMSAWPMFSLNYGPLRES